MPTAKVEALVMPAIPMAPLIITLPSVLQVQQCGVFHGEVQTVGIQAQIQHVDNVLDDLAEGQGHDGQIVALQAQYRHADDDAEQCPQTAANDHRPASSAAPCRAESLSARARGDRCR